MWCFLQCKGTWRAFYHTSIHHLPRGTPFHRFALDLKVWDPFLVDVCLCGRGGTTKKDGGGDSFLVRHHAASVRPPQGYFSSLGGACGIT